MANLCGANEAIDNALSKALDLKNDILGKLELPASDIAASANSKLTELKSALDGFTVDLPTIPDINVQAEITGLISDIDKTSIQGLIAFNSKVAQLKLDFGDTFKDKGLDLDEIISSGTDLISGGGDICALVPNLDIPASASGTGVTTEELVERSSAATLTLTQTPKEILSVQGKKTGQSFFTNINYKQNGLVIVPSAAGTYSEIKVTYIVSLIKEKPINSKQADKKEEQETAPIVTTNTNALDTKTFSGFGSLLKKLNTKSVLGLTTEKEKTDLETAISTIGSPTLKSQMNADFAKANAFLSGKGPGTLSGEISSSLNGPVDSTGKQSTIKVTTPKNASTVTKEKITKVNPTSQKIETVEVKKTTRAQVSSSGFTNRRVEITESFWFESLPKASKLYQNGIIDDWVLLSEPITPAKGIKLKHRPALIIDMLGRQYNPDGQSWVEWVYRLGESGNNTRGVYLEASDTVTFFSGNFDFDVAACSSQAIVVTYEYFEKIDPSVKG